MRRRVVFLIALGLGACTADQPTEPTTAYEGAALSLALPPVPAPPTLLTATIPGANGAPSHITLGVWESPVVARVTVEGLPDYSGNPQGFLPGTGQIDAAGRYVGYLNSCSLQLSVRVVGYGFIGGYKGGCPNAPQQIGSFTNYTVVSGEIYSDRITGPPGSCYFGGSPCTAITGVETVEVEPLDGAELAITATNVKVAPGGSIRVDVTPTPAYLEGVKVPWTFREFRWEGQGPTVGGGQTKVCIAQPAVGECLVAVYQSGFVVAEAIVNGRLKTKKIFVAVIGGDSLPPPPPPDSIPADTIPTDTIPTGCGPNTAHGLHLADCQPPEPPTATVQCSGSSGTSDIVRGTSVSCTVTVSPAQAFTVTGWQVAPQGGSSTNLPASNTLSGPAVVSSDVGATVIVANGAAVLATSGHYAVQSRAWAKYQMPNQAPYLHSRTFDDDGELTRGQIRLGVVLGVFVLRGTDFKYVPVETASSGPNTGYAYFETAPVLLAPHVYTHPQFGGGPWYSDQNGGFDPSTKAARCQVAAMPVLEGKVEVHEGVTRSTESHWWIAHELLEFSRLTETWEASIDATGNANALQQLARAQLLAMFSRMKASQLDFDAYDYPRVFGSLGCALDMDPSRGDG